MKLLLHICCASCSVYPVKILNKSFYSITGFFYNSNIHPFSECITRKNMLKKNADKLQIKVIHKNVYNLEKFIRGIAFREKNRCYYCYYKRIFSSAYFAKKTKF